MKILSYLFSFIGLALIFVDCQPINEDDCPACPEITEIIPNHGRGGEEVLIVGNNFQDFIEGIDKVTFNGKEAILTDVPGQTTLMVQVPPQAGTGSVVVQIGQLSSIEIQEPPVFQYDVVRVDSISPSFARKGEIIFIHGAFFSDVAAENVVGFAGDAQAEVVTASDSILQVMVPSGARSGAIQVEVENFMAQSPAFTYVPTATVSTYAGLANVPGYAIGELSKVKFNNPIGIAIDKFNNVYVTDSSNGLRKIDADGVATNHPFLDNPIIRGIAIWDKRIFASDDTGDKVIEVTGGFRGYSAYGASFFLKRPGEGGLAIDNEGNLYASDLTGHMILRINPFQDTEKFVGNIQPGYQDGTGQEAQFNKPTGLAMDNSNNLIVCESVGFIRKVTTEGEVSTIIGPTSTANFNGLRGIAIDGQDNIYVADTQNHRICLVTQDGLVTTLAGKMLIGEFKNGIGDLARFNLPSDIARDSDGNLYVTDTNNHVIRKITLE